jgi:hypothetical protein
MKIRPVEAESFHGDGQTDDETNSPLFPIFLMRLKIGRLRKTIATIECCRRHVSPNVTTRPRLEGFL